MASAPSSDSPSSSKDEIMKEIFGTAISVLPLIPTQRDVVCYWMYLDNLYRSEEGKVRFGRTPKVEVYIKVEQGLMAHFEQQFPSRTLNSMQFVKNQVRPLLDKQVEKIKRSTEAFKKQSWKDLMKIKFSKPVNLLIDNGDVDNEQPDVPMVEVGFTY